METLRQLTGMTDSEKEFAFTILFPFRSTNEYFSSCEMVNFINYILNLSPLTNITSIVLCENLKGSMEFNDYVRLLNHLVLNKFDI